MGVKLGTLLVREGVIGAQQLEEALRIQVLYGGRLGTNLVELRYIEPDALAQWLSRMSGFPPVTEAMLSDASDEVVQAVTPDLAERFECFPLRREGRRLHVAMANPADLAATDALSFKTGLRLVLYVVPELMLYEFLEKRYGVVRKLRYARLASRHEGGPAAPTAPDEAPTPVESAVPGGYSPPVNIPMAVPATREAVAMSGPASPGWTPRFNVSQLKAVQAGAPSWTPSRASPSPTLPISVPPARGPSSAASLPAPGAPLSYEEARTALSAASTRGSVADVLLRFAPDKLDTMLLFVLRDGMALGWRGRGTGVDEPLVDRVMLPLNAPSMFQEAADRRQPVGGPVSDLTLHKHFFKALRRELPTSALVVPVLVGDRAVNLIYVDRIGGDATALAGPLVNLAALVTAAYGRILRESKRPPARQR
jgi:hypothetical protein